MPFESIGLSSKDRDRLIPARPAMFLSFDYHSAWINSKAVAIAKIDKNTSDTSGNHSAAKEDDHRKH
jgi:predicted amidohydrolase YtcJ